ncbi:hypothetical protein LUA82_04305 [Neoehrlichia mikurensis]|uniref:Uncharacterized protein n=1 Tax=Neoehrlichia mikurensis TaxID=89586 RepID=A0A9Q9BST6_9RICK|nr:hypothetical protein [Neoehrlichia mikurensis]UTO55372.1 hypothetical protein LUA82_04305 [Neoehrlichia mikurensis]
MKPLSQLVYDYIFDSILFNLYLKSNSKKLYSAELDKVYSTIRSFMCKDDAENFTVSIAKKLNKPNFINSANLTAFICKVFLFIKSTIHEFNNNDNSRNAFITASAKELVYFYDIIISLLTFPLCYNNNLKQYYNEVYTRAFTFQHQYVSKVILRHADQAAKAAIIYNIAKKLNKNVQFSIKDACKIKISYEEMFDILHKRQVISIAKDAAKAANLYNKVKELNDKDTQSPILEIKDAIRISKMSSGAQNIIVTSITQPLYKKK